MERVMVVGQGYVGLPVAVRAVEAGYDVVGFEATGEEEPWAIRASRDLRVDRDNVTGFRSHFHDLAERHGGEFDGWEAAED